MKCELSRDVKVAIVRQAMKLSASYVELEFYDLYELMERIENLGLQDDSVTDLAAYFTNACFRPIPYGCINSDIVRILDTYRYHDVGKCAPGVEALAADILGLIPDSCRSVVEFDPSLDFPPHAYISQQLWDSIASCMDDDIRENLDSKLAPCRARDFLMAYCRRDPAFEEMYLMGEFRIDDYEECVYWDEVVYGR